MEIFAASALFTVFVLTVLLQQAILRRERRRVQERLRRYCGALVPLGPGVQGR